MVRVAAAAVTCSAAGAAMVFCCACSSDGGVVTDGGSDATAEGGDAAVDAGGNTTGSPCNPVLQNCADPNDKCTYLKVNNAYSAICVAPTTYAFTKGELEPCNRASVGDDDCAKGFACLPNGAQGVFACFKACAADTDCAGTTKCVGITSFAPYFGACEPSCTLFGGDCDGGSCGGLYLDVSKAYDVAVCHANGSGTAGATCAVPWDCGPNLSCISSKCIADCDDTHPCADAGTCAGQGLPNDGGVCP